MHDQQRRAVISWQNDLSQSLDYLETRNDVEIRSAGYMGLSRGATYTAVPLVVEDRLKAAVLMSGGVDVIARIHPMVDMLNYASHIKIPILMINGRYDHIYPHEQSQKRMFDLLGAPPDKKKHIVDETGHHAFPPNSTARDATDWFDQHLGAVR